MSISIFRRRVLLSFAVTACLLVLSGILFAPPLFAAESTQEAPVVVSDTKVMWACISAALAFGIGAFAAGQAISHVGTAAMGAMSEKPEVGSQALIFIALAEGLAVFGFITALMILGKV